MASFKSYVFDKCEFFVTNPETGNPFDMFDATGEGRKNGTLQVKMPASTPFQVELAVMKNSEYQFVYPRVVINGRTVTLPEAYFRRLRVRGNEGSNQHLHFVSASNGIRDVLGNALGYNQTSIEITLIKLPINDARIPWNAEAIEYIPDMITKRGITHAEELSGGLICTRAGPVISTDVFPCVGASQWESSDPFYGLKYFKVVLQLVCTASDEEKAATTTFDYAVLRQNEEVETLRRINAEKEAVYEALYARLSNLSDLCNAKHRESIEVKKQLDILNEQFKKTKDDLAVAKTAMLGARSTLLLNGGAAALSTSIPKKDLLMSFK
jgi:hypothetical protein